MLVDPPIGERYNTFVGQHRGTDCAEYPSKPYLGGYEDFSDSPSISSDTEDDPVLTRRSLFDNLLFHWSKDVPPCFQVEDPTLTSIAFFALNIIAAEWIKYLSVMYDSIKRYEYPRQSRSSFVRDLEKLHADLHALQSWRRRSMLSLQKIRSIDRLLRQENKASSTHDSVDQLIEDFEHIATNIEDGGRRLENMLPVVTSLVQIVDTRRSFAETANVSRLTILALVFIPLSFVSSLFSMNSSTAPGAEYFWVYFAVAVPLTIAVFVIARPPSKAVKWLLARMKPRSKQRKGQAQTAETDQDVSRKPSEV